MLIYFDIFLSVEACCMVNEGFLSHYVYIFGLHSEDLYHALAYECGGALYFSYNAIN